MTLETTRTSTQTHNNKFPKRTNARATQTNSNGVTNAKIAPHFSMAQLNTSRGFMKHKQNPSFPALKVSTLIVASLFSHVAGAGQAEDLTATIKALTERMAAMEQELKASKAAQPESATKKADQGTAELDTRVNKLEQKVGAISNSTDEKAIGKVKFNFWGRYMLSAYSDISPAAENKNGYASKYDSQVRYKLKMSSQLQENVTAFSVIGADITYKPDDATNYNSPAPNSPAGQALAVQKVGIRVKSGNWYTTVGRQGANESDGPNRLGTGLWLASSTGFDGISTYYKDPDNGNNKFFIGGFQRSFGGANRNVLIANASYDVTPRVNLLATYFEDGKSHAENPGVTNASRAQISTIGTIVKLDSNNMWKLVAEAGHNSRADVALASTGNSKYSNGQKSGWDALVQYNNADLNKPGSWAVSADYRKFNPGFNPYSGAEWIGGALQPKKMGIVGSNSDNVKGAGLYFEYVPYKNVIGQISMYSFAPVVAGATDGKYRQSFRFFVDYMF